jgi:hypothetical protein
MGIFKRAKQAADEYNKEQEVKVEEQKKGK